MPSHKGAHGNSSSPASNASMNPCSPEGSGGRSNRQRLKPWLEAQINSNSYPGLEWLDREKRIFRMTWKHNGRADWSEEDASIFKAWAIHTGRYREGVDDPDWPTWKTRLRCAINKLKPEIQEVREEHSGDEPRPYRVFQFFSRKESGSKSTSQGGSPVSGTDEVDGSQLPKQDRPSVIQSSSGNIPTFISEPLESKPSIDRHEECVDTEVNSLGSDLQHVSINDLVPASSMSLTNISVDSNINSYSEAMDTDSLKGASGQPPFQPVKQEPLENPDHLYLPNISDHEMLVTMRFRDEMIQQVKVTNPEGCRVFFGDLPYQYAWDPEVFGSKEADQILVPYTPGQLRSAQQEQYTLTLLNGLELGVSIVMDKRNIYVERRCKSRIITVPANRADRQTLKVERQQRLKVFDFRQDFLPAFLQYEQGEGPRPSPQVVIAIGQDFHTDVEPYTHLFFSVTVCHAQASHLLCEYTMKTTVPELSDSNQFDRHMMILKESKATVPITSGNQTVATETVYRDSAVLM